MELKKIRLLGYYSSPNQKMNPETEKIEEANALAPLLESSIESLLNNPGTDSELKKTLSIPSVFVFKDETGGLYGYHNKNKIVRLTGVKYDRRHIKQVDLRYKAWFVPGQSIDLIDARSNAITDRGRQSNTTVRSKKTTTAEKHINREFNSSISKSLTLDTDEETIKVKTRLRLENNYFIGQFSPERTEGWYRITDIRNTDFTKIEDKERGVKNLIINFRSPKEFNRFAYYRFTWVLLDSSPLKFGIDLREEIVPIYPQDIVKCLHDSIVHYPASAAKKITRTLDTLNKQLTQSGKEVFIYELLQNANDYPRKQKDGKIISAVPVDVEFHITDEYLTFQHTGEYFNAKNIAAICDINDGEKSDNVEAIGYKGIGFKTVFLDNDYVYLNTGNYSFRFDKSATDIINTPWQILPVWTDSNKVPQTIRSIFSHHPNDEFRVKFALKPRDSRILTNRERKDNYIDLFASVFETERVILFIPNIRKVSILIGDTTVPTIVREKINSSWCVSEAMTDDVPEHIRERINDVLTNSDADKSDGYEKIPEKYLNFYKTAVKFACKREGRKLIPVENSILYCYLPAKRADWGFKFLMNTDMVPNGARDDIEDIELNHEISKIAGRQFFYWIKNLIGSREYELDSIFNLIPDFDKCKEKRNDKSFKNFIEEFQNEFETLIKKEPFVPVVDIEGNEKLACIDSIIDDRTGITEKNVMSDSDFISIMRMDDYFLPIQELRSSKCFMEFLYHHCSSDMDIDFGDIKSRCLNLDFQEWLKNQSNNSKLIGHLLEKEELSKFSSEPIFIEFEGELYKACNLYYDYDTKGSGIDFLKRFVPNLCEHTRKEFCDNNKWETFVKEQFMDFDAQSIIEEYIADNADAIELIKDSSNSVCFYNFVAQNDVDLSEIKEKIPYITEDGEATTDYDGYLYFFTEDSYKTSKESWLGDNVLIILSHIYFEEEDNALKKVFEGLGFNSFSKVNFVTDIIAQDSDFKNFVNACIEEDFEENFAFLKYVFSCRESLKEKNLLFKEYVLSCIDIDGDESYLCNDDLRYFNQESYAGNSTFEDNKSHEWLTYKMMYSLNSKYFEDMNESEAKNMESFIRQQFGVKTFTDKSFFTEVVLKNKKEIYASLIDKDKMLAFIGYLKRDMNHIFDGTVTYNEFNDMPLLCADGTIINERKTNVKLVEYNEEAIKLYEKDWCPAVFAVMSEEYSIGFSKEIPQRYYNIIAFDFNETLSDILNSDSIKEDLKDSDNNIDFWRWIKTNVKKFNDFESLKGFSLLDQDNNCCEYSSLYISDSYQNDGIETLVRKYDDNASFVSDSYLEEDISDPNKNEWLKLFKKLGLKFDNKDILLNSVLRNLPSFEEDSVVAMMSKHIKDLKEVWNDRKDEIVQLRVRTKSGEYKTLDEAIIVDIPEESVVEPFKYISLSDEVAPDILLNNKELLRLVAKDCSSHRSIASKQEWAEEKVKEYISNIQIDEERRDAIHIEFVRELAKLSEEYSINKELYDDITYMVKGEEPCYLPASDITLGNAYSPICNFEANGVSELNYLSEEYIFESNKDTIKSFFKHRGLHQTMTEDDIEYLPIRSFALYFWSTCFSKSLSEYEDWITRGLFDDIECIPTETSLKKPEDLYFTRMWVYASKSAGWKERVPYKSVIDSLNNEARDVFDKLPYNSTLSFKDCIGYLLNATDKREDETSRRREICNWILQAEDIDNTIIASYRENPRALWRNGKGQNKHISELYVIHPDARQHREIFRGNEFVMATSMFPFDTDEFVRLCDILGVRCLTDDDFVSTPKNKVDQTVEMMKELKPRILVLSAIENADKYKERYTKYDEIISNYRFYVCDEIDLGYDTIHNDVVRIYEENNRIYYVTSWQHSRTFTRFCSKIKSLLDITVIDNVFEDVFDESRSIEQNIEKYCADLVYDDDFRYYLENLDCSVPNVIEEEITPEEEDYYSATSNLPKEEEASFDSHDAIRKPTDEDYIPKSSEQVESQSHTTEAVEQDERQDSSGSQQSLNGISEPMADIENSENGTGDDEIDDTIEEGPSNNASSKLSNGSKDHSISQGDDIDSHQDTRTTPKQNNTEISDTEKPNETKKPRINDEYVPVNEEGEPYVPNPDDDNVMGDVADDLDYQPVGEKPAKSFRRKVAKPYTKEELNRLRSNGTPLELESLPPTDEEIDVLAQCGISVEQIADTNYLAQLRLYNNLVDSGEMPEESREEFVKNAADVAIHKLKDGRYIHTCSAARGVMYISPSVWNKMIDDKWKVCVYLDGRGKNFHYINSAEEFLKLVVKDDVVIKITGKEKVDVVKQLYSGILENVKGTAYTLIRVASRTNMDAVFAHYVGAMAETEDGNDTNEY